MQVSIAVQKPKASKGEHEMEIPQHLAQQVAQGVIGGNQANRMSLISTCGVQGRLILSLQRRTTRPVQATTSTTTASTGPSTRPGSSGSSSTPPGSNSSSRPPPPPLRPAMLPLALPQARPRPPSECVTQTRIAGPRDL